MCYRGPKGPFFYMNFFPKTLPDLRSYLSCNMEMTFLANGAEALRGSRLAKLGLGECGGCYGEGIAPRRAWINSDLGGGGLGGDLTAGFRRGRDLD